MSWNSDFDRFVGNASRYLSPGSPEIPPSKIHVLDSDVGRNVGFERVSPHLVVLPPHCRTSSPHAESLEEEFVYVVKGAPSLWLNGFLYQLEEGHAVGFPAGTGIAHTFINNTDEDVHLLVVGERTKADNLCSFPINPELRESCGIWWEDPPQHELGPHKGMPGPSELTLELPDCVVHCPSEPPGKAFHYPGDNETFGQGFRISNRVGLVALGIWFERLPPGKRSAFPHAHTHEEEFVFVVKGHPTVWMNGFAKEVGPGDFAAFPSNTGIAHTIINNTDEEVIYVCVGEAQDFDGEKITYPHNDLRRIECERRGEYWLDAPDLGQGPVSPMPDAAIPGHLAFRPMTFEQIGVSESFREVLGIELDGEAIGIVELHVRHPEGVCEISMQLSQHESLEVDCLELANDYLRRVHSVAKCQFPAVD